MYEWLKKEIQKVKTRRFHVVDGPSPASQLFGGAGDPPPPSYREFLSLFGGARLYHRGGSYLLGVRREAVVAPDGNLWCIGHFDEYRAYFRRQELASDCEAPVYEWSRGGLREVGESFDVWLESRARSARRSLGRKAWKQIMDGPSPFTLNERTIVEARKQFRWRVVGVNPSSGALRFEISNGSNRTLPYLSLGVRARDGRMEGGVRLPVASIEPGTVRVIERECYKGILAPDEVEVFSLPDPEPEDRDRYWEFRG